MKYSNTVEYNISTKLDSSGLTKLQSQIKQLEASMQKMSNKELIDDEKISAAKTQLEGLNAALTKSFNPSLGILDLSKFRLELESSGVSAKGLQSAFSMMGAEGKATLNGLTTQIANFNGGMERTSSAVDKIFTTFSNTFRWGMVSSFFSQFMNAIHSSVDYVKELDDSLTQIMLVTDYNKDSMNEFARSANEAAKAVSMTTTGMTNASLIFAQQGYDLGQSQELATLSAKVANASQQDTATTSDQITAYMNAYGLEGSISELTQAMDNWALIANISAADVGELAQASQRAASMANAVGVSGEALAAQIATIESVTREAPEQIGNGLKTLYARFSDISLGGEDEDGIGLGKVTSTLEGIGVKVLDQFGNIRTMDDIMEDLMVVWDDLDSTTKTAAAQALAGKYQVNRFEALMENSDMYRQYKDATGENAAGTLDIMNAEYANSIAGRSAKMQASLEGLFSTIFNTDDIYPWMDAAQGAVDLLQQFFDALGGGKVILLGITSLLTQAFSQNMARSINDMVANHNLGKIRERNINGVQDTLTAAGIDQTQGVGAYIRNTAGQAKLGALNGAQYDNYMANVQQWADTSTKLAAAEEDLIDNVNAINLVYGKLTTNKNAAVLESGDLDTSLAAMTRQGLTSDWIAQKTKNVNFSDVADEAKTAAFALRDLQSQFDELHTTSGQLAKPIDDVSIALESLTATNGYSSNSVEKIKNELNELRTSVEQGDITFEDAKVKIQKYINEMERLSTIASEMDGKSAGQILAGGGVGAQKAKTDYDFAQIQEKAIAEKANSDQDSVNFQQNIKGVLDMVAAMQQLAFAVEAFHNIGSIWSNEDLTQGEKITQTIMNLTTVLFNATTGMKNFYDGMKGARGLLDSIKESIIKQAEAIQQKKILEEQATQTELQNAQQRAQAEVAIAEAEKVTADTNILKAETALQSAKANLEEAQASLSSLSADQAKIDNIKLIAQAHLTAAQAAIAHAEAEGQVVDPRAEADMLEAQDSLAQISAEQLTLNEKITTATKAVSEAEQDVLQKEKELTKAREEANAANEKLVEKQNLLVEATNKLSSIVGVAANVQRTMSLFDSLKTVALDALDKMGLSVGSLVTKLAGIAPVLLPLMALFGTAYGMFKDIENKKAENSQNYEEAKAQLEKVQSLTEQANNFQQQYESQKGTEQAFDGLTDSAKEYAQSLKDLGEEDKAHQVESAILRAELQNTEGAYQNLSDVVKETQETLSDSTYIDMMNKAYGAISNTGESVQFLAEQEQKLKDKKAELNNLAKDDPYRVELEAEIAELEEFISKNQEAFEAKDQLMSAALDYNLNQASKTNGWQLGVLNTPGDEDLRSATLDWQSLNSILEQSVPGFAQITDENERLALALAHTSDEAQRAAIQIQQMLNESDNLTDDQKTGITRQLEQSDLSAEQSAQVVAALSIDKESTYNSIVPELQDILNQVNEGENLEVVLKAKLSPEELEESIRSQLAAYEPKDEDVESEDFQSLSNMFMDNADKMGEEGTPFEDYSEDLLNNADALEEVVEGILRYDDAVQTLDDNLDDWRSALNDTNEFSKEHIDAVQDLQETYSDFLDLSEDMDVSEEFAANAENLELMEDAANGVEGAYEDLANAAAEDILIHADVSDVDAAKDALTSLTSELPSLFEGVDIGGALDLSSVEDQINALADATGWSADQMAAYLNSIGINIDPSMFEPVNSGLDGITDTASQVADGVNSIVGGVSDAITQGLSFSTDTEMTEQTATKDDTVMYTNLIPSQGEGVDIEGEMPSITPATIATAAGTFPSVSYKAHIPGVQYTPEPVTESQVKEMTGYGVKSEVTNGPGGKGGVKLKQGASATRGSRGGSGAGKSSRGSRPSGGGGGGSCFVAGTLVTTLTGFTPIEQIKQGDIVLSYNELLHQLEYSKVVQTMIHDITEPIYTLHVKNEQLRVTGIHRFLISHDIFHSTPQWIPAADLQIGDWMFLADSTWHLIHNIEVNVEHQVVYNFEVAGNHNYYVGRNQILAHNKGGKSCFVAGTPISMTLGYKPIELIKPDDFVLSYNESSHQNEYSKVIQTMIHDTKEPIYTLYIKNERLRVTGIHRFLISKNINFEPRWVAAQDLQIGDWVLLADGTWHLIWKIEINIEKQVVYNFEVAGNHNYYVGKAQILAHNKGGKGGSGKKGGGGGKAKTIENKEKKEHKKDYYEEVSNQLEKTEKILSKIEKEEDRLIGDKARANQNKQLSLLTKEIELNKDKQKIQQQELKDVDALIKKRDKLAEKTAAEQGVLALIPDMQLDEDGIISNYEDISKAIDETHNKLIEKYNAAAKAGNEDLTKEIQKTIEKFDKYGEDLLKQAQRHNKLQSEIEETTATLEGLEDKIEDIRIDAYKAHQEAIDDLKDLKEDSAELAALFRDFDDNGFLTSWSLEDTPMDDLIKSMHELDDIYNVTKEDANKFYQDIINKKKQDLKNTKDKDERAAIQSSIKYFEDMQKGLSSDSLQNGLLGLALKDVDQLEGWIKGTNKEANPFGKNTAALWEAYEDAYKRAVDLTKEWRETVQDLEESIIDIYDEQEDAIERTLDNYDRVTEKLERIQDTYTLYYGEDNYDEILAMMDQQGATMQQHLDDLTKAFNYWQVKYQEAIDSGDKKLIQEIKEKMDDAEDAMLDKAEELAEHWVERFEKSVDASIQKIDIKLWGGGPGQTDLEDQSTIWELQKDYMDTYKDDVEKAYEVDKLRSKYIGLLNDAQGMSLQTQNKIRAQMQEQLDLLDGQKTVSEYDVKLANAKLEILQKQIALEDAQRNKNKMQLRRDTQGNYRYVYTAEQGDVQQAQDELNESQFDAYEMTKEQTIANNDRAINLYQDYMNKMRDIAIKYKDDEVARNKALAELAAEYKKLLGGLEEDFSDTTNGMYEVLTWMIENGTQDTSTAAMEMMDQLYDKSGEVKENTGNDWRDLATQISTEVLPNIQEAVTNGINDISTSAENLKEQMTGDEGVLPKIGSSTDTLNESIKNAKDTTEQWAQATEDLFEAFSPDNKKVQAAMKQLTDMSNQLKANQEATSALSTKLRSTNAALQSKTAEAENYRTTLDYKTGARKFKTGDVVTLKAGAPVRFDRGTGSQYYKDKDGTKHYGFTLEKNMKVKIGNTEGMIGNKRAPYPIALYPTGESLKEWGARVKETGGDSQSFESLKHQGWHINEDVMRKYLSYKTGGYTGDWNEETVEKDNGKLAFLHQKELVLNATDTQNILAAVNLIRSMTNGVMTNFSSAGFGSKVSSSYNPITEQRVEIQASFPNATDAEDIRQALIGLSDKAYQYARRTI